MLRAAILATTILSLGVADAGVRGEVESTISRWDARGEVIVTDVMVRGADGSLTKTVQLGGTVDGIGMSFSHTAPLVKRGDKVDFVGRGLVRTERAQRTLRSRPAGSGDTGPGVQRTSFSDRPLFHPSGCINFQYDVKTSFDSTTTNRYAAFDAAFEAWEDASDQYACGGISFVGTPVEGAPEGRDGINTIHFRDREWCRPATQTEPELCHDDGAVAVTRLLFVDEPTSSRDGEIIEIDIDINAVDYTFSEDGSTGTIDLQSAATHEVGHALGLDHNCGVEDGSWPTDRNGDLVPACESLAPALVNATMYVQVQPGTTSMRAPKASDVDGMCESIVASCTTEVTGAGCSAGGRANGAWLLLALVPFVARRRRDSAL